MLKIGLCQCKLSFEQPEENLAMMERFLLYAQARKGRSADRRPDLLLFPELTLTGFTMKSREFAIGPDSEMIERARGLAVRYKTAIGFGCVIGENEARGAGSDFAGGETDAQSEGSDLESEESEARGAGSNFTIGETDAQNVGTDSKETDVFGKAKEGPENKKRSGSCPKNTYLIISHEGELLAEYAKLHPFSYAGENLHYSPGNSLCTFTLNGIRFGITVCYDLRFPEIYQAYADTCDAMIVAANWPAKRAAHWNALLKARAIETQCCIAAVNCVGDMDGQYYRGDSQVIWPDGERAPGRWIDIPSDGESVPGRWIDISSDGESVPGRWIDIPLDGESVPGRWIDIPLDGESMPDRKNGIETEGILLAELDEERVRQVREAFPVRQDRRKDFYRDLMIEERILSRSTKPEERALS